MRTIRRGEFCVQYGESDRAFLARLWAEEGIFFFERFAADSPEQKLTLCDDVAGLSQAGEFPFNPDASTGAETECVSMFRYEAHVRPSSVQSRITRLRCRTGRGCMSSRVRA